MSNEEITISKAEYIRLLNDSANYNALKEKTFKYTLLSFNDVLRLTNQKKSTLLKAISEGDFPLPIKKAGSKARGVMWLLHEIEEWVEKQMANRPLHSDFEYHDYEELDA